MQELGKYFLMVKRVKKQSTTVTFFYAELDVRLQFLQA